MACVTTRKTKNGAKYDIQFYVTKSEKKKFFGFTNKRQAERFAEKLDSLVSSRKTGLKDTDVSEWLAVLAESDPERYAKLAEWGLVARRVVCGTLGDLIERFTADSQKKERTIKGRQTVGNRLLKFFGDEKKVSTLSKDDATRFFDSMLETLSPGTWKRDVRRVKQCFDLAVELGWIEGNPFKHLKGGESVNTSRHFFISLDDSQRILEACPNAEMRLIFSLARFGGLRIPSELQFMEWNDIDLTGNRFTVKIPKKTGKKEQERGEFTTRAVPMFPELRKAFTEYFEALPDGAPALLFPFVNGKPETAGQALKSRFLKILHRAGVPVWPKFFQNMRSTRETELLDRYPIQDVTAWIGNTPEVARKHYLQTRPENFLSASQMVSVPTGNTLKNENRTESTSPMGTFCENPMDSAAGNAAENPPKPLDWEALKSLENTGNGIDWEFIRRFVEASRQSPNSMGILMGTLMGTQGISGDSGELQKNAESPYFCDSTQEMKKPCNCLQGIILPRVGLEPMTR